MNFYVLEPKNLFSNLKEIGYWFCLGYIKSYIQTFIKSFEDKKHKFNSPEKIINAINGDNSIYKIIRIFIYKILYINFGVDTFTFINQKLVDKYEPKDYKDFSEFISINELNNIYKIDDKIRTLKDEFYEQANKEKKKVPKKMILRTK